MRYWRATWKSGSIGSRSRIHPLPAADTGRTFYHPRCFSFDAKPVARPCLLARLRAGEEEMVS
jgi:hypothetical protein